MILNTLSECINNQNIQDSIIINEILSDTVYYKIYNQYIINNKLNFIYTGIPENIYVCIQEPNDINLILNKTYIFDFMELLLVIAFENKNIQTDQKFSDIIYNELIEKYSKEVKMVRRYKK